MNYLPNISHTSNMQAVSLYYAFPITSISQMTCASIRLQLTQLSTVVFLAYSAVKTGSCLYAASGVLSVELRDKPVTFVLLHFLFLHRMLGAVAIPPLASGAPLCRGCRRLEDCPRAEARLAHCGIILCHCSCNANSTTSRRCHH